MLLRFGVANHLSIRERQELSFAASSLKDRSDGLIACKAVPSGFVVPAAAIYGANASGKTSVMHAISTMCSMVTSPHVGGEPGRGVPRRPFALDANCAREPSRFDIDFVIDDVRYHYGFEATDEAFTAEWLYAWPGSRRRTMFVRDGGTYDFGRWLKGQNASIARMTGPNGLFLSAAAQNGHRRLSEIYGFFRSMKCHGAIAVSGREASKSFVDGGKDARAIEFLRALGTGVVGFRDTRTGMPESEREIHSGTGQASARSPRFRIPPGDDDGRQSIELERRDRAGKAVHFDLDMESAGTRRLLLVVSMACRALDEGVPLCLDDLGSGLHTRASAAIVKMFCRPGTNRNGAQLLAATHDTNLLGSDALRRDQIWFAEKKPDGATELYPLTDIRTRKGDNIARGYLQGRYGAVPDEDPLSSTSGAV